MIYCGFITTVRIIKIIGVLQIILAIVATSIGIAITFKFRQVNQDTDKVYQIPIGYVETPWTTKYCAGVWIGLVMLVAGGFNSMSDVKPEKSKYIYASLVLNFVVAVFSIIIITYIGKALIWFKSCSYTYHDGETIGTNSCSEQDKTTGLCTGLCFRKIVYKYKDSKNRAISFKTKNTRVFDQEMQNFPQQEILKDSFVV
ncbi:uncharacterized protein LOC100209175 isoform X2 [Hydra vulgaris]|uniref:uncharacterized protein LOC100209175 isoform X2 n=1 Tax=Hydra vulgaris TaxID=6087 RepID=UPI000640F6CA|nr:uncharacterized protein LOC100209175 isoform X2 [Hydra vulgaris]